MNNRVLVICLALAAAGLMLAGCASPNDTAGESLAANRVYAEAYLRDIDAAQAAQSEADQRRAIEASLQATEAAAVQAANDAEERRQALALQAVELYAAQEQAKRDASIAAVSTTIEISRTLALAEADASKIAADAEQDIQASGWQKAFITIAVIVAMLTITAVCLMLASIVYQRWKMTRRMLADEEMQQMKQRRRAIIWQGDGAYRLDDGSIVFVTNTEKGVDLQPGHKVMGWLPDPNARREEYTYNAGGKTEQVEHERPRKLTPASARALRFLEQCRTITGPDTVKLPTEETFRLQHKTGPTYWQSCVDMLKPDYLNGRRGKGTFIVHTRYAKLGELIAGLECGEIVIPEESTAERVPAERVEVTN